MLLFQQTSLLWTFVYLLKSEYHIAAFVVNPQHSIVRRHAFSSLLKATPSSSSPTSLSSTASNSTNACAPPSSDPVETKTSSATVLKDKDSPLFVDLTDTTASPSKSSQSSNAQGDDVVQKMFLDEKSSSSIHEQVSEYYGKTLTTSQDLQTDACCTKGAAPPEYIKTAISNVHPDVRAKYYGCGLCLPQYDLEGCHVLDLGCGAGRDVYIASQLVGSEGSVTGIDMTPEQLNVAKANQDYHAKEFGYSNVNFLEGYLEELPKMVASGKLKSKSFDVIISNCVLNLCSDKEAVLRGCIDLLKPGGEFYFSDVYANRRVPTELQQDSVLWGECLSGALYWNDFENMARRVGFTDPRLVEDAPIDISSPEVEKVLANHYGLKFYSATYRLLNLPDLLEPHCEDYGQAVIYKGSMTRYPSAWSLDKHHVFESGKVKTVCGNTFVMLQQNPKLEPHFEFIGNFDKHYGLFDACTGGRFQLPFDNSEDASGDINDASAGACC